MTLVAEEQPWLPPCSNEIEAQPTPLEDRRGTILWVQSWPSFSKETTIPPRQAGATLSGCPSKRLAIARISSSLKALSGSAFAPARPATIAVALLPRPQAQRNPIGIFALRPFTSTPARSKRKRALRKTSWSHPGRVLAALTGYFRFQESSFVSPIRNHCKHLAPSRWRQSQEPRLAVVAEP